MNRLRSVLVIVLFTFLAFVLSMTADLSRKELGALVNLIWLPLAGGIAILLYLPAVYWVRTAFWKRGLAAGAMVISL